MSKSSRQDGQEQSRASQPMLGVPASNEEAVYEDPSVPYVPPTDEKPRRSGLLRRWSVTPTYPPPPQIDETGVQAEGYIFIVAVILGAALGALFAYFTQGNMLAWACVGAAIGAGIPLLIYAFVQGDGAPILTETLFTAFAELFNCCAISSFLMIASFTTIGVLLFTHGWL